MLLATLACATCARGEESQLAGSPQILLKAAVSAPSGGKQAEAWLQAGLKCELLTEHGRLLPDGLSLEERKQLAADLLDPDADAKGSLKKQLATFPAADGLVFDGQGYAGANLSYIDSMLGFSGRPIAFDRELPALLVPLSPEAEAALTELRAAYITDPETRFLRDRTDQTQGRGTSPTMLGDGQFLRPYAGRFDDLYFHLFQNGNAASALAFCALVDGLADQVYRPLKGVAQRDPKSGAAFDVGDILSAGGKNAVRQYLDAQSGGASAPFQQFAFRVLPGIVGRARTLRAGEHFTATPAEILSALRSRQLLYPTRVPPLYRSPDRFLGWAGPLYVPVANRPALPPGATDSWYPLPQRETASPADQKAEHGASAQLFKSSSAADLVWEDPQFSNLLADPAAQTEVRKEARTAPPAATPKEPRIEIPKLAEARTPPAAPATPMEDADPRKRAATARLIAVVTPTLEEAKGYFSAIAASDETLRTIEQARGRLRLLREFMESARTVSSDPATDSSRDKIQQSMAADLASFQLREQDLATSLQAALKERARVRTQLAERLQRDRVAPLQTLGKSEERDESKLRL